MWTIAHPGNQVSYEHSVFSVPVVSRTRGGKKRCRSAASARLMLGVLGGKHGWCGCGSIAGGF